MNIPFEKGDLIETLTVIASNTGTHASWRLVRVIEIDTEKNRLFIQGGDDVLKHFLAWIDYSAEWFRPLQN